jgi:hypothetical protein
MQRRHVYSILLRVFEEKKPNGKHESRYNDNTKCDLKYEGISLANPDPEIKSVRTVKCPVVFPSSRLDHRINSSRTGFSWLSIGISRWDFVNTVPSDYIYQVGYFFYQLLHKKDSAPWKICQTMPIFSFYAVIVFSPFSIFL